MTNILKNLKTNKLFIALFATILLFALYFQFNIMNITDYFMLSKQSLEIKEKNVIDLKSTDKKSFTSKSIDPNISFSHVNKKLANISIYIDDMSVRHMDAQIYIDNGNGFSESNSYAFRMRKGNNNIKINDKNLVKAIRFDPTSTIGEAFKVNSIELNNPVVTKAVFFALPFIFIFIFTIACICKRYIVSTILSALFSYNIILFLDKFQLDSKLKLIIFLCLILIVVTASVFLSSLSNHIVKQKFSGDSYE